MNNLSRVKNRQRHPMPTRDKDRGFTLIEFLVIIGAIGILVGIAIPAYKEYIVKAQIAEAKQVIKDIERAIIALAIDTGEWPHHQEIGKDCQSQNQPCPGDNEVWNFNTDTKAGLIADDPGTAYLNWNGPYFESVPLDPWGHNYFFDTDYKISGVDNVVLGSYGPEAVCNNCYNDTDIRLILPLK